MKKLFVACCLALAGLGALAYETVTIPTLPAPGIVDGDLADASWKKAYVTKPFAAIKPGDRITEETVAYLFCTADTLYIGAKCSFADYALREKIVNAKSNSGFTGDCIEMFIDPGDTGNYAHIAVNVAGNITAQGTVQPIKCCTQLYQTYWMMEAEIPFASIKLDAASYNANWRLNVARGNYRKGECSSWSKLENGVFGEPASFNAISGITVDLVAIAKAQKAAARKDFEIALDHIVYTDQTDVKATLDFLHAKPITGFKVEVKVKGEGEEKKVGGESRWTKVFPLTAFHAEVEIPLKDFADGKYVATLTIVDAAGKAVKSGEKTFYKVPPMKDSDNSERFTIKDHCFYKNGQFFFPIITWALTSSGFKSLEDWRAASEIQLADLEEHGFNAGITGGYMFSEEDPDTMRKTKSLAAWHTKAFKGLHDAGVTFVDHCRMAQKHGVAVIATSPYRPKSPFALDCFVDHVTRIRKAPNVMVWHTADETDGQVEYNALLNQLYHEIDPTRLTWLNVINAVAANRNAADILATDPYPIPNGRVTAVAAHADRLVDNTKGRPQIGRWLWIQNFGGEGGWTRPPTPAEVKCMSMLAINHGVKGLAYFTYQPPARRDGVRQHPEGMSMFKEFSPFLQKWTPALCQGKTVFQGRQGDLDVLAVTFEGRKILSVVNVENKPVRDAPVKIDGFCDKAFTLDGYGISVEELPADALDIGSRRELLCDGLLVDAAKTTASRVLHHPDRLGQTVFVQDAPWEVCTSYGTILRDEKGYHLYYIVAMRSDPTDPQRYDPKWKDRNWSAVCYATSPDAIHWTRPILRRSAFMGSKENNILFGLDFCSEMDNFSAFIDTNPACPPSEKYKGLIQYSPDNTQTNMGLYWVAGPDPVNLTLRGKVVQRDDWGYAFEHGGILIDTQSTAFWDSVAGCYRCYTRGYHPAEHDRNGDKHIRDIRTATSKDFRTWSDFKRIGFGPGAEDIPLYTNLIQPYPRAPQLLVGFPTRYVERQKWTPSYDALPGVAARRARMQTSVGNRAGLAITDAAFMCSRDGVTFQREDDAFLAPGPEGDCNWIYGDCYPYYGFVETAGRNGRDAEYSMFLFARDQEHKLTRVNRCTIRKDGFVSYHGTYRPQHLVTRPLVYRGGRLSLNFATSARGYVRLVIRAADGSGEARSCEIFGDATDREIVFEKGSVAALAGRPVTLDFELSDADVYSFAFGN